MIKEKGQYDKDVFIPNLQKMQNDGSLLSLRNLDEEEIGLSSLCVLLP